MLGGEGGVGAGDLRGHGLEEVECRAPAGAAALPGGALEYAERAADDVLGVDVVLVDEREDVGGLVGFEAGVGGGLDAWFGFNF